MLTDAPSLIDLNWQGAPQSEPLAWIKGEEGLIGFGEYARIQVQGSDRFAQARNWWQSKLREFEIHNNVHGSGTGPILFASFSFDESDPSYLVIPRVLVGRRGEKRWITWIGDEVEPALERLDPKPDPRKIEWSGSNGDLWRDRVSDLINRIKSGSVEKVVLARSLDGIASQPLDPRRILKLLHQHYPTTWSFLHTGLIGATPELLVRLSKSMITSRVLAGTIKRTGNDERDLSLAASLARSSKDLEEHEYAVRSVADAISPICSSINAPESPFVLHLANVMHLATDVTGVLNDSANPTDVLDALERLHPSAAVCGTPRDKAQEAIEEVEGAMRGRYAGPVGWIDIRMDGEFGIALRCGQIDESKSKIRIYAGCGIVASSDPSDEYAESEAKLLPMRSALAAH
ncbi:MAG: isochorismate synthase [Actinobacteria bacterium]|nr:isochorismate synthase [Actinomycetota bacterium]